MKKVMYVALMILLGSALNAYTGEHQMGTPVIHTKDFEKLKELAGVWEGKMDTGKGMETIRVTCARISMSPGSMGVCAVSAPGAARISIIGCGTL